MCMCGLCVWGVYVGVGGGGRGGEKHLGFEAADGRMERIALMEGAVILQHPSDAEAHIHRGSGQLLDLRPHSLTTR